MSAPIANEQALQLVLASLQDPSQGLPGSVFSFILKVTPLINVDILIQEAGRGTLLTWRDDEFGTGWHIPGGIIRLNEPAAHRISEVARLELATTVEADSFPIDIREFFYARGHFISLLYRCRPTKPLAAGGLEACEAPHPGSIGWFKACPPNIYPGHEAYSMHIR